MSIRSSQRRLRVPGDRPAAERASDRPVRTSRRRTVLGLVAGGGATLAAGGFALPALAYAEEAPAALSGVWGVEFRRSDTPVGVPGNRVPVLFTADGGVVIGFRPSTIGANDVRTYVSSGVGQWIRAGQDDFVWAYTGYTWNDKNDLSNTFSFRVLTRLGEGADTLGGTFSGGPMDLDGKPIGGIVEGTIEGKRLFTVP
jgi:hypothetical protein